MSDRDYISLGSVNNSYKKWIEDVPSLRYCLTGVTQYLPEMYYHVLRRDDKAVIVRMPDCPAGYAGGDAESCCACCGRRAACCSAPPPTTPVRRFSAWPMMA